MKTIIFNLAKTILVFFGIIIVFAWCIFGFVVAFGGFHSPLAIAIVIGPMFIGLFIGIYRMVSKFNP